MIEILLGIFIVSNVFYAWFMEFFMISTGKYLEPKGLWEVYDTIFRFRISSNITLTIGIWLIIK